MGFDRVEELFVFGFRRERDPMIVEPFCARETTVSSPHGAEEGREGPRAHL